MQAETPRTFASFIQWQRLQLAKESNLSSIH